MMLFEKASLVIALFAATHAIGLGFAVQQQLRVHAVGQRTVINPREQLPAPQTLAGFEFCISETPSSITRGAAWGNEFIRLVHGSVEYAPDPANEHQACAAADMVVRQVAALHAEGDRGDTLALYPVLDSTKMTYFEELTE
ncbi:hypothetical protein BKA62DRAFT_773652 [Auriculariales sp. MPI-PUGE-AT-0066]|nr:hypothetical protein BKA62DRAFT_773652 [Auriculariales sp. MPI-PUGE-AT-0066]